jgi:hypothetical protein
MTETLYNQLVTITEEYLGPAAPRFIDRQIAAHLGKTSHEITASDLPKLAEWTRVTLGLLTEDRAIIDDYSSKVARLSAESSLMPNGAGQHP